jgi:hypothetical protein
LLFCHLSVNHNQTKEQTQMKICTHQNRTAAWLLALAMPLAGFAQTMNIPLNVDGAAKTGWFPPDENAAAGPNHIVELVNDSMFIYNKQGQLISSQDMNTFFGTGTGGDVHVIYNEITGRFAIEVIESLNSGGTGAVGFAVSDSSDPTGTWHKTAINVPGLWDGYGGNAIGYNADAYVVHVNGFNNQFAVIAANNNPNLNYTIQTGPSNVRIGRPLTMPGSQSGDPFYFLEGNSDGANGTGGTGGNLELVKVSNITGSPAYTDYQLSTGSSSTCVFYNSWRNNLLATIGVVGSPAAVKWFLLQTSNGGSPTILQGGSITPPDGGSANDPSISVAPNGSLGLNYASTSGSSMNSYIAGRLYQDASGTMRSSVQISGGPNSSGRYGDFSSCVVDINTGGMPLSTFLACAEYMNSTDQGDWKTRLVNFTVSQPYFMIVNKNSGKCWDLAGGNTANGTILEQWTMDSTTGNQRWAILPTEQTNHFKIISWVSGKCESIVGDSKNSGVKLNEWDYVGNDPAQQFDFVDVGNGWFKIQNVNSGLVCDDTSGATTNGTPVQQYTYNGTASQMWRLQPWGNYNIRPMNSPRYISVQGGGSANGSAVVQYDWQNNPWFQWNFVNKADGWYACYTLNASTEVISVDGDSNQQGTGTQLWNYNNDTAQQSRIVPVTDGTFRFYFEFDGMSWDMHLGGTGNNVLLDQYPDNNTSSQHFQLDRIQ